MTEADMIAALADGHRRGTQTVQGAAFADLDRPAAYRIQSAVLRALGATAAMLKTGIHGDGIGVAAPIYDSLVGRNGFNLPVANALGLEVEVGLVLGKNVATDSDIPAAVDRYFVGVEIVGSRFTDRKLAGLNGPLADNISGLGYVIGAEPRRLKDIIDGLTVTLEFAKGHNRRADGHPGVRWETNLQRAGQARLWNSPRVCCGLCQSATGASAARRGHGHHHRLALRFGAHFGRRPRHRAARRRHRGVRSCLASRR